MYGFYYHFNNLRVILSHTYSDFSAAWPAFHLKHAVICFLSSELLKRRLLTLLLDHPMKDTPNIYTEWLNAR